MVFKIKKGSSAAKVGGRVGPASKKVKTSFPLTRSDDLLEDVIGVFLDSQSKDKDQLTDVHLVCKDGIIPVHAIILKAASKLFAAALESQGDSYLSERIILLPDYSVKEMRDVVQVIYSGTVLFSENENAQNIEEILKTLGVENIKSSKSKGKSNTVAPISSSKLIRCYRTKQINQPITGTEKNLSELKPLFGSQVEEDKTNSNTNSPGPSNSKILRKRQIEVETVKSSGVSSSDDSDYSPERRKNPKRKNSNSNHNMSPRVIAERLVIGVIKTKQVSSSNSTSTTVQTASSTSIVPVKKVNCYNYNGNQYQNNEDENEPDSDSWEEPDYNNKAWFETEARRCQKCQKQHVNPAAASTCITSHQRLRCYFCFDIAKNTEKLFEHFNKKHKQAGRENCLMCPYCEQTVPFKSVSCHVISIHLQENRGQLKSNPNNNGPGRPAGTVIPVVNQTLNPNNKTTVIPVVNQALNPNNKTNAPSSSTSTPKEIIKSMVSSESTMSSDDGLLRVGDLDVTIRNKLGNGKIMVYHLQKDRSNFGT